MNREAAVVEVRNARGLHARASSALSRLAVQWDAKVQICKDDLCVDADSVLDLLMLSAGFGSKLTIEATGPQAADAVAAIVELVENRFGEAN